MWLAPKVILSNQVDNKILAVITKPSKILERTLISSSAGVAARSISLVPTPVAGACCFAKPIP